MGLPNPDIEFVPITPGTAEDMNNMVENIESLSAGTGFEDGAIDTDTLAESAVTLEKFDTTTIPMGLFYLNSSQNTGSNAFAKVKLDSTAYNRLITFDGTTNNRVTITEAGIYHIDASVGNVSTANGSISAAAIYKNGSRFKQSHVLAVANTSTAGWSSISFDEEFAVNDYIELWFFYSGSAVGIGNSRVDTFLNIRFVG